jgi:hypothetical protein
MVTREGFERRVVTLGIQNAQAISAEDQLFAQQTRHPRFARHGIARDEHVGIENVVFGDGPIEIKRRRRARHV